MKITVRKYSIYKEITVEDGSAKIITGFINDEEAEKIASELEEVISDLRYKNLASENKPSN